MGKLRLERQCTLLSVPSIQGVGLNIDTVDITQ